MTSAASAADKFAVVARLLSDMRVNELLKENRILKVDLFWTKYNYLDLQEAMRIANRKYSGPNCCCNGCLLSGRMRDEDVVPGLEGAHNCTFKPFFEELLADCGLTSR